MYSTNVEKSNKARISEQFLSSNIAITNKITIMIIIKYNKATKPKKCKI